MFKLWYVNAKILKSASSSQKGCTALTYSSDPIATYLPKIISAKVIIPSLAPAGGTIASVVGSGLPETRITTHTQLHW